jgi:hypothetical protein
MTGFAEINQKSPPSKIPKPVVEPCDWEGNSTSQPPDDIAGRCADGDKPIMQRARDFCDFMGDPPSPPTFDIADCAPEVDTPQSAPAAVTHHTSSAATAIPASLALPESTTQPDIFSDAPENARKPPSPVQMLRHQKSVADKHLQVSGAPIPPSPAPQTEHFEQADELCLDGKVSRRDRHSLEE